MPAQHAWHHLLQPSQHIHNTSESRLLSCVSGGIPSLLHSTQTSVSLLSTSLFRFSFGLVFAGFDPTFLDCFFFDAAFLALFFAPLTRFSWTWPRWTHHMFVSSGESSTFFYISRICSSSGISYCNFVIVESNTSDGGSFVITVDESLF